MAYLLDANVFIQAKNFHYGFDFCPAFWDWLEEEHRAKRVFSIGKILVELQGRDDDLAAWALAKGRRFFLPQDEKLLTAFPALSTWVHGRSYRATAISTFLQEPDYYLVAHALSHGDTVVTHEKPSNGITQVKIPEACLGVGVKCMTPFEMLRKERARFALAR